MSNFNLKSGRGATSVRAPVIVNQLGPEIRQAIADHWSLPSIIALDAGQLAGATIDVTDPEPPPDGDPIYQHPKIVLTPHISWTGGESSRLLADKIIANLDAYARGTPLSNRFDRTLEY